MRQCNICFSNSTTLQRSVNCVRWRLLRHRNALAAGVSEGGQTSAQRVHLCTERTLHRSTACWPTQAGGPCCGQSPSVPVTEQQTQTQGGAKFSAAEDGSRCPAHRWSVRRTPTKVAHAKHRDRSQAQQRRRLTLRTTVGGSPFARVNTAPPYRLPTDHRLAVAATGYSAFRIPRCSLQLTQCC